jgi:hypothetical protein
LIKATIIACVLLFSSFARAEAPGYVDIVRVRSTATEPKRQDAEFRADQQARSQKINEAIAAAQKAKPADQNAAWAAAGKVEQEQNAAIQKHADEVDAAFMSKMAEVLAKLRTPKRPSVAAGARLVMIPGVDLTAEAIRAWNEADAQGMAAELEKTRAENERLKAAAAKPDSPKK